MFTALSTTGPFKGQMNQNLDFFSLAILKWGNVKQYIRKETYAEIFFWAVNKSKKVKIMKTGDGFTKKFPKWLCSLMKGMEVKVCFVMSLLSWTLLCFCVSESFAGKVLDINTKLILLGKWLRSLPFFWEHYWLVYCCFCGVPQWSYKSSVSHLFLMQVDKA